MGHLEVYVDGMQIDSSGRAQRKPFDLLKRLVTHPSGIDSVRLMDSLWPDVDGDSARNAFDMALHRLRKLLKHKDAIVLSGGRLCLNPRRIWVDAFVLAQWDSEEIPPCEWETRCRQLVSLYRAPLLVDDQSPDVYVARARLRSLFVRLVFYFAHQFECTARHDLLAELCRRALEAEPLEESLYRIWMRSLLSQGHQAEAAAVYHRCAESFAALLKIQPSRTTRDLLYTSPQADSNESHRRDVRERFPKDSPRYIPH